ncbi:hypothetical protein J2S10_004244 [Neobacillus ginsengisoli]|uniref:Uncharacterized protein n=1 Tax=Neobacillus ginsengisoli TaxID=904295 RepID=A0ABT9XZQ4_9BACI|nr:hypothetical protein [Neobacillus ginsengisoli]
MDHMKLVLPISFVFSTNLKILSLHCFAPFTNKGTPMKSIFIPLEKKPPSVIAGGTVGEVLFKALHSHNVKVKKIKKMKSIMKLIGKLARIFVGIARRNKSYCPNKVQVLIPLAA